MNVLTHVLLLLFGMMIKSIIRIYYPYNQSYGAARVTSIVLLVKFECLLVIQRNSSFGLVIIFLLSIQCFFIVVDFFSFLCLCCVVLFIIVWFKIT